MELFSEKLNNICIISQIEADCAGTTVMPPGNFKTSKEDGSPNIDGVRDRFNCWRTSSTKDDLNTLRAGKLIDAFLGLGRTAKSTYVQFVEAEGRMEMMETWCNDPFLVNILKTS